MNTILFLLLILATSVSWSAEKQLSFSRHSYLSNGCMLFEMDGKLKKTFPGRLCLYLDDGKVISSTPTALRLFDNKDQVIWEITGNFSRQINLSFDKKRIFAFRSHTEKSGKEVFRQDQILVISLEGKILHEKKIGDLLPLGKAWTTASTVEQESGATKEYSHFNSINEIPSQLSVPKDAALSEGNIVVNSLFLGTFVLSPDLGKILKRITFDNSFEHVVHDVQVTPDGKIIYFNNRLNLLSKNLASSIHIYDPGTEKVIYSFSSHPPEMYYSECCGSVQIIDKETMLFSGMYGGAFFLDMKGNKIIKAFPYAVGMTGRGVAPSFTIKLVDLEKFFSHRQ